MEIKKKSDTVTLIPDGPTEIGDLLNSDDLFWEDLRIVSSHMDGNMYLIDDNSGQYGALSGNYFNDITKLCTGEQVKVRMRQFDETYHELFDN